MTRDFLRAKCGAKKANSVSFYAGIYIYFYILFYIFLLVHTNPAEEGKPKTRFLIVSRELVSQQVK